jgi:hypothetical protein
MPSKILTPYGDLGKKFKFLKEVKFLSEFFRSKLVCLIPIYVSGRPAAEVTAVRVEAKNLVDEWQDPKNQQSKADRGQPVPPPFGGRPANNTGSLVSDRREVI